MEEVDTDQPVKDHSSPKKLVHVEAVADGSSRMKKLSQAAASASNVLPRSMVQPANGINSLTNRTPANPTGNNQGPPGKVKRPMDAITTHHGAKQMFKQLLPASRTKQAAHGPTSSSLRGNLCHSLTGGPSSHKPDFNGDTAGASCTAGTPAYRQPPPGFPAAPMVGNSAVPLVGVSFSTAHDARSVSTDDAPQAAGGDYGSTFEDSSRSSGPSAARVHPSSSAPPFSDTLQALPGLTRATDMSPSSMQDIPGSAFPLAPAVPASPTASAGVPRDAGSAQELPAQALLDQGADTATAAFPPLPNQDQLASVLKYAASGNAVASSSKTNGWLDHLQKVWTTAITSATHDAHNALSSGASTAMERPATAAQSSSGSPAPADNPGQPAGVEGPQQAATVAEAPSPSHPGSPQAAATHVAADRQPVLDTPAGRPGSAGGCGRGRRRTRAAGGAPSHASRQLQLGSTDPGPMQQVAAGAAGPQLNPQHLEPAGWGGAASGSQPSAGLPPVGAAATQLQTTTLQSDPGWPPGLNPSLCPSSAWAKGPPASLFAPGAAAAAPHKGAAASAVAAATRPAAAAPKPAPGGWGINWSVPWGGGQQPHDAAAARTRRVSCHGGLQGTFAASAAGVSGPQGGAAGLQGSSSSSAAAEPAAAGEVVSADAEQHTGGASAMSVTNSAWQVGSSQGEAPSANPLLDEAAAHGMGSTVAAAGDSPADTTPTLLNGATDGGGMAHPLWQQRLRVYVPFLEAAAEPEDACFGDDDISYCNTGSSTCSASSIGDSLIPPEAPGSAAVWQGLVPDPGQLAVNDTYTGPHMTEDATGCLRITEEFVLAMTEHFKSGQHLHARYAWEILQQARLHQQQLPTLVDITLHAADKLLICGDVHGQCFDLLKIFELHGNPSPTNPFLFNGDLVDRGSYGAEVVLMLLAWQVLYPGCLYINRGNHESRAMNSRYGFSAEMKAKYGKKLLRECQAVFDLLPLATLINSKVLVVHGGLPRQDATLNDIRSVDRNREPFWESLIMYDLLWSDPIDGGIGKMESPRGAGMMWGEDVTIKFLADNGLELIVRSHQHKELGHETQHGGRVITVFSAPNYCGVTGNKGAVMELYGTLKFELHSFDEVEGVQQLDSMHYYSDLDQEEEVRDAQIMGQKWAGPAAPPAADDADDEDDDQTLLDPSDYLQLDVNWT